MTNLKKSQALRASLALVALLAVAHSAAPAQTFNTPRWQVGTSWDVTRQANVTFSDEDGTNSGTMDVTVSYTLTIVEQTTAFGWPAWRATFSDASVSGSGSATTEAGSFDIFLGPDSTANGTEVTRLGDLATISDSFTIVMQVQTEFISFDVTIANATLALSSSYDRPSEEIDFPIHAGDSWAWSTDVSLGGRADVDFVGLAESIPDINETLSTEASVSFARVVESVTSSQVELGDGVNSAVVVWDNDFGRPSLRTLPDNPDLGINTFIETVSSVSNYPNEPTFDLVATPSMTAGGADFSVEVSQLTGATSSVTAWLPDGDPSVGPIVVNTGGADSVTIPFQMPLEDDETVTDSDDGSFHIVAKLDNDPRYHSITVFRGELVVDSSGLAVR